MERRCGRDDAANWVPARTFFRSDFGEYRNFDAREVLLSQGLVIDRDRLPQDWSKFQGVIASPVKNARGHFSSLRRSALHRCDFRGGGAGGFAVF